MKKNYISILLVALCTLLTQLFPNVTVYAQTGTIGTGTGSGLYHGPIYRFSASSTSNYTKNMMLYTEAELLAAGLTVGAQITSLAWYKDDGNKLINGASGVLSVYLKDNSTYATEFPTGSNIVSLTQSGFTIAAVKQYNAVSYNLPSAPGWVTITLDYPFTYTGGNLEIYCDWVLTPGSGNPTDGAFNWRNHSTSFRTLQMFSSAPLTASGTTYRYNLRGDLQIGYSSLPCSNPPSTGVATIAPGTTVCPNTNLTLDLTGASTGLGISYEWEASPNNTSGSYISLGAAQTTPSFNHTPANTTWYRCKVVCNNGTPQYTNPIQVTVDAVNVNLGSDTTYCEGNTAIVLDAGNPGSTYLWNDNSTAQTLTVNSQGTYYVTVTNANGCVGSDTIQINYTPLATGDFTATEHSQGLVEFNATANGTSGYFWNFGHNNATAMGQNVSYTYPNNGFYNVTLNLINDCGDTTKILKSITVSTVTVGINDVISEAQVNIYPNPAQNMVTIENNSKQTFDAISITDVLGKTLYSTQIKTNATEHIVNTSSLSPGTYFITIQTQNGKIIKPFTKQ